MKKFILGLGAVAAVAAPIAAVVSCGHKDKGQDIKISGEGFTGTVSSDKLSAIVTITDAAKATPEKLAGALVKYADTLSAVETHETAGRRVVDLRVANTAYKASKKDDAAKTAWETAFKTAFDAATPIAHK